LSKYTFKLDNEKWNEHLKEIDAPALPRDLNIVIVVEAETQEAAINDLGCIINRSTLDYVAE
jgi:hypothetical protein